MTSSNYILLLCSGGTFGLRSGTEIDITFGWPTATEFAAANLEALYLRAVRSQNSGELPIAQLASVVEKAVIDSGAQGTVSYHIAACRVPLKNWRSQMRSVRQFASYFLGAALSRPPPDFWPSSLLSQFGGLLILLLLMNIL